MNQDNKNLHLRTCNLLLKCIQFLRCHICLDVRHDCDKNADEISVDINKSIRFS